MPGVATGTIQTTSTQMASSEASALRAERQSRRRGERERKKREQVERVPGCREEQRQKPIGSAARKQQEDGAHAEKQREHDPDDRSEADEPAEQQHLRIHTRRQLLLQQSSRPFAGECAEADQNDQQWHSPRARALLQQELAV